MAKLAANDALRQYVQDRLAGVIAASDGTAVPGSDVRRIGRRHGRRKDRRWASSWSPEQIANRIRADFADDESMRVSHEAIYQALYVQGRGALRRELVACLWTGRALRVPRARTRGRGKKFVTPEIMISGRPAEAGDRAVPGRWEGDLILGLNSSAIGTLAGAARGSRCCCTCPAWKATAAPGPQRPRAGRARRRSGPGRDRLNDHHPARPAAPVADLGPGRGDGPARPAAHRHRASHLLLRPAQPLGSAARTRTPTACCGSTSPRTQT